MSSEEFQNLDKKSVLMIDIREEYELQSSPLLDGTLHIPMSNIIQKVRDGALLKNKPILTICRSGSRCKMLNEFLVDNGFEADYLEGGLVALNQ